MKKKTLYADAQDFFKSIIDGIENGTIEVNSQAKCVGMEARLATPEEVGTKFMVWSHGKIEKEIIVKEDTVFLTTLDRNGKPIVDEGGHKNTYDMPFKKFARKYKEHINGHYVQDYTPMVAVQVPESMVSEEGIKLLPPCWEGYAGTLMRGGLIMLPFNPKLSSEEQIAEWKKYIKNGEIVDWCPNNEADTYSPCDEYGIFEDESLQELYGQTKEYKPHRHKK